LVKPKPVFETIKTILGRGADAEPLPCLYVYLFVPANEDGKFAKKIVTYVMFLYMVL